METHVSINPAAELGSFLSHAIADKSGTHDRILILLSGGSALRVLEHIDAKVINEQCVFMMADDRFSTDPSVNNYLQLTDSAFNTIIEDMGAGCISTVPNDTSISPADFAHSLDKALEYFYQVNENVYTIALLGIGSDGHTASIFPTKTAEEFKERYQLDKRYLAVHDENADPKDRISISPYFIKNFVDTVLLYAVGEEKCVGVLSEVMTEKALHKLPAKLAAEHSTAHLFTDCQKLS